MPDLVLLANSAQNLFIRGDDPWITALQQAIAQLAGQDIKLITSRTPYPWDMAAFLAGQAGIKQVLLLPESMHKNPETTLDLGLNPRKTEITAIDTDDRSTFFSRRDRKAFEMADYIFPLCIKPGGRLEKLIEDARNNGKHIDTRFRVDWRNTSYTPEYDFSKTRLTPDILPLERGWLTHWTRSFSSPWPEENTAGYFNNILRMPQIYCHDALHTLANIINNGVIHSSDWKKARSMKSVSFTGVSVQEAIRLMNWRKRYNRYTFEPYGIAIRLDSARKLGIEAVKYEQKPDPANIFEHGTGIRGDWQAEAEWRYPGDLNLAEIDRDSIRVLVYCRQDIAELKALCSPEYKVVSILK